MHEALALHSLPGATDSEAFRCSATPEDGAIFLGIGHVVADIVGHLVFVVPWRREDDVVECWDLRLGEDGKRLFGWFEGGGRQVEAMEVGEVGLVAEGARECPVG